MMIGRDESMPNVVREADLPSEVRDQLREFAATATGLPDGASGRRMVLNAALKNYGLSVTEVARAILRYVPAGVPAPAPVAVAAADDRTRPAQAALEGGLIGEPMDAADSDGVIRDVSDDGSTSCNRLDLTAAYDPDLHDATRR